MPGTQGLLELDFFLHTGEVQGSIPCASTRINFQRTVIRCFTAASAGCVCLGGDWRDDN
jgi:hypothetical protein